MTAATAAAAIVLQLHEQLIAPLLPLPLGSRAELGKCENYENYGNYIEAGWRLCEVDLETDCSWLLLAGWLLARVGSLDSLLIMLTTVKWPINNVNNSEV